MLRFTKRQFVAAGLAAAALPLRAGAQSKPVDITPLKNAMAHGRFVTYQATQMKVVDGALSAASDDSIRADLAVLRPYFDSLIIYGALAGNERVPDIAAALGFRAVVVGVWDINDRAEVENAIAAWRRNPGLVVGLSLGNEVMLGKRGTWADLSLALDKMRAMAPGLPLTTTESFSQFLDDPEARPTLSRMDFMLVNIHPVFESWFASAPAFNRADFVGRVVDLLAKIYSGPILVKETGTPTAPVSAGFSEDIQAEFYRALEARLPPSEMRAFSYFSSFDAAWRVDDFMPMPGAHPEEAHWGIFTQDRRPKKIIAGIPKKSR